MIQWKNMIICKHAKGLSTGSQKHPKTRKSIDCKRKNSIFTRVTGLPNTQSHKGKCIGWKTLTQANKKDISKRFVHLFTFQSIAFITHSLKSSNLIQKEREGIVRKVTWERIWEFGVNSTNGSGNDVSTKRKMFCMSTLIKVTLYQTKQWI